MTVSAAPTPAFRPAYPRGLRALAIGLVAAVTALLTLTALAPPAEALTGVDLATYKRVGRHDLPEPTRTAAPAGSLLAQEASGVTYDWNTDSLFVVGDGGTSVVQVSKTGQLIDSMTLAAGGSPQGTTFYDTEGIAYIGNGEFVIRVVRQRRRAGQLHVAAADGLDAQRRRRQRRVRRPRRDRLAGDARLAAARRTAAVHRHAGLPGAAGRHDRPGAVGDGDQQRRRRRADRPRCDRRGGRGIGRRLPAQLRPLHRCDAGAGRNLPRADPLRSGPGERDLERQPGDRLERARQPDAGCPHRHEHRSARRARRADRIDRAERLPGASRKRWRPGAEGRYRPSGTSGPSRQGRHVLILHRPGHSVGAPRTDANLSLRLGNSTTAPAPRSTATASGPASLHLNGPSSVRIAPLRAGERRTVQLPLRIGSNAVPGRYTVKVELEIGGRTAARTVTVIVTR